MKKLPLSIRDVKPFPEAVRLTGKRSDGIPDGVHTGGAYLLDDEVWKPLDGRPFQNADYHLPTLEAQALELMADEVCFPRNWHVESRNGREWLVRRRAHLLNPKDLSDRDIFHTEQGVRLMNKRGWEIGDDLSLAYDGETYQLFIVDLSCAHPQEGKHAYAADEYRRVLKLFRAAGYDFLASTRERAIHLLGDPLHFEVRTEQPVDDFRFVYGSFNRPISRGWATLPDDAVFIDSNRWFDDIGIEFFRDGVPHTWVVTREKLNTDIAFRYELQMCWSVDVEEGLV